MIKIQFDSSDPSDSSISSSILIIEIIAEQVDIPCFNSNILWAFNILCS